MGLLRNRLLRRFTVLGRAADVALVAGVGLRFALRKGWISDDQVARMGLTGAAEKKSFGIGDLLLAGGAFSRLARRRRNR